MDPTLASGVIDGVLITPLRQIADERGAVLHMLRSDAPEFSAFGEVYFSEVLPGAIKAWKRHLRQTQVFAVPVGRIRLVIADTREGSSTQGRIQIVELGRPDAYVRVRVPPLVWYGFSALSATPALLANCADLPHDPAESQTRPLDDPSLPDCWGAASQQPDRVRA